jgi:phosphinothricin acetyltransferase
MLAMSVPTKANEPAVKMDVRPAAEGDLQRLREIYNHYVRETPITFDLEPLTIEQRRAWFQQFDVVGKHRLFVAESHEGIVGYAGSHRFRDKAAYDTTIEATVYCAAESTGQGAGKLLYEVLFDSLQGQDLRLAIAGITLPNPASIALHERFDFKLAGVMHGVGRKFGKYWDVAWYEKLLS